MQMGAVEQAAVVRWKAAGQNIPAKVGVAAVGKRGGQQSAGREHGAQVAQQEGGPAQMLEHVRADYEIEAPA